MKEMILGDNVETSPGNIMQESCIGKSFRKFV